MKNILFLLLLLNYSVFCQKHDYIWVTGHANQFFNATTGYGGSLLDFNQKPLYMEAHRRDLNMYTCNASMCDTAGNLIFYTNGCDIAGADDEILENGEDINPGAFHVRWCDIFEEGYNSGHQSAYILPLPEHDSIYYLFHEQCRLISIGGVEDVWTEKLLYSKIEFDKSNQSRPKWIVSEKNIPIIDDTLAYSELISVKHANGKDWWIVTPRRYSNEFYVFKFTQAGIVDTLVQTIGAKPFPEIAQGVGQMTFSPKGNKIYRTERYDPVFVYDFDRETGMLSNFDTISFDYGDQFIGEVGCSISPSGQYMYLACRKFIYQFDLLAPDVSASQILIGEWDGFATPIQTLFYGGQLAPDCKIYVFAGGDTKYWNIIHNPDNPGLACNFEQRGLVLPTRCGASMPSFPNYRLGPIDNPGLPCESTVSTTSPANPLLPQFSVFPNPAQDYVTITRNQVGREQVVFRLYNQIGEVVLSKSLSFNEIDNFEHIGLEGLVSGAYFYEVVLEEDRRVLKSGVLMKI